MGFLAAAVFSLGSHVAVAATLPAGFTETVLATGISNPTQLAVSTDGRVFVAQQGGNLRVVKNGALLSKPFLTVTVSSSGERGLLGVALDPNFPTAPYVYVYYTATTPATHNRVSRFTASGDVAVAGSELVLMDLDNLSSATNHNGGGLHFGKDGMLYFASGENASTSNAQSLNNLLGKVSRIYPDGSIPTDNPFYTKTTGKNRAIWAYGLRNPFAFNINRTTGMMLINDVGQSAWEEVNVGTAGANYGWPATEGSTTDSRYASPLYAYSHSSGNCAIVGGAFYVPSAVNFPKEYEGDYFFMDYCGGWIKRIDPATKVVTTFATGISSPADVATDEAGFLYYTERGNGARLVRVAYTTNQNQPPAMTQNPQSQTVSEGKSASFTCAASGTSPITYKWQKNQVDISGASGATYTLSQAQASDNGMKFRCLASNSFGSVASSEAILTVTKNVGPTVKIVLPVAKTLYRPGQVIGFQGQVTDPEDGNSPATAYTWQVDFHHDTHVHPFMPATSGIVSGSFTIPTEGETSRNVWYRVYLTGKDSKGLTATTYSDIFPAPLNVPATLVVADAATKTSGLGVSGGWALTSAGYVQDSFNFASGGALQLVLNARSMETEQVWPKVELRIDQTAVATVDINSVEFKNYTLKTTVTSGVHQIAIAYINPDGTVSGRGVILSQFTVPVPVLPPTPDLHVKVNFQLGTAPTPAGYLKDEGLVFGQRGAYRYGWNVDNQALARWRQNPASPDVRYDTLNHMNKDEARRKWSFKLPNGVYRVHLVTGDPDHTPTAADIVIEGKSFLKGQNGTSSRWLETTKNVEVLDGRLSMRNGPSKAFNKICFIEIDSVTPTAADSVESEPLLESGDSGEPSVESTMESPADEN